MLEDILVSLRNWFDKSRIYGEFEIKDSVVYQDGEPLTIPQGQYFRIIGSLFNDGLHSNEDVLVDEVIIDGSVWLLAIPQKVISLADEIKEWQAKNGTPSPFQSESFAGYSYTKATNKNGGAVTWQDAFYPQLRQWRKL